MTKKISELSSIPSVDGAADYLEIVDTSTATSHRVTRNGLLNISGNPVGDTDSQTLTNKTLTSPTINTPTITVNDNALSIRDNSDTTKVAQFELSGITTGTTRTYTLPNASSTLVDLSTSQTLTSKTLTSPTINNPTLAVDSIAEFNSAAGVTIDGVLLKDSKINGSYITDTTVSSTQINFGGSGAGVWWEEIGRTTLGGAGDTITVSSIPARKYLRIFAHTLDNGSATQTTVRFNNDSAANYATRFSINGAADSTGTSGTSITASQSSAEEKFTVMDVINVATALKFVSGISSEEGGATVATAPDRLEYVGKWGNVAAQISRVDVINSGAGDYAIGSEVIVLGHN